MMWTLHLTGMLESILYLSSPHGITTQMNNNDTIIFRNAYYHSSLTPWKNLWFTEPFKTQW
jgi:hypothetical protein